MEAMALHSGNKLLQQWKRFPVHTYFAFEDTFRTSGFNTWKVLNAILSLLLSITDRCTQTNVSQAGSVATYQTGSNQSDLGTKQEEVNWNDQDAIATSVRADKSSNDADPNELFYYPKAFLAINIVKFNFALLKPRRSIARWVKQFSSNRRIVY